MTSGVSMQSPETCFFSYDTIIKSGCIIEPNVCFGTGVKIQSSTIIKSCSYIEGTHVGRHCQIGPFARLRPGTNLLEEVKIGNFVEVKKSQLGAGSKVNHLSYIGDANLGTNVNVGAGTITANYDGVNKHLTRIGNNSKTGANSVLVAPVTIGDQVTIGAGSTITKNVPDGSLAIGRAKQMTKEGWASRGE